MAEKSEADGRMKGSWEEVGRGDVQHLAHMNNFFNFHNKFLQRENDNVNLRCEVIGGNPAPTVTWWREHTLLDTRQTVYQHKVVSHLTINQVSR